MPVNCGLVASYALVLHMVKASWSERLWGAVGVNGGQQQVQCEDTVIAASAVAAAAPAAARAKACSPLTSLTWVCSFALGGHGMTLFH